MGFLCGVLFRCWARVEIGHWARAAVSKGAVSFHSVYRSFNSFPYCSIFFLKNVCVCVNISQSCNHTHIHPSHPWIYIHVHTHAHTHMWIKILNMKLGGWLQRGLPSLCLAHLRPWGCSLLSLPAASVPGDGTCWVRRQTCLSHPKKLKVLGFFSQPACTVRECPYSRVSCVIRLLKLPSSHTSFSLCLLWRKQPQ